MKFQGGDRKEFLKDLAARVEQFQGNPNHDERGRFTGPGGSSAEDVSGYFWGDDNALRNWKDALSKAKDTISDSSSLQKFWVTPDGKFAPIHNHMEVIPGVSEGTNNTLEGFSAFKKFATTFQVVRVAIDHNQSNVHIFHPMSEDQVSAIATQIIRPSVTISSVKGMNTAEQTLIHPSYSQLVDKLDQANKYIKTGKAPTEYRLITINQFITNTLNWYNGALMDELWER